VRGIAARDYPLSVIDNWAPLPITDAVIERFLANHDDEIRLIAEADGSAVGIGAILVAKNELRACYVLPDAVRSGVGSAIVEEIERLARTHRLDHLQLESSVTAEPFYAALGYHVVERGQHLLGSGIPMAAVRMRKEFG
jgi:putative acetyltransferase